MKWTATLTKKLGPLPVWGWGVIAGVVILVGYYYYSNNKKAANAGEADVVISSDDLFKSIAGGSGGVGGSGGATSTEPVNYETNTSWRQKGVALLIGSGVSPLKAQAALDNYIQGNPLTSEQAGYVNTVITALGLPPDGTFGIPSVLGAPAATPAPTPTVTPPAPTVAPPAPTGATGATSARAGTPAPTPAAPTPSPTTTVKATTPPAVKQTKKLRVLNTTTYVTEKSNTRPIVTTKYKVVTAVTYEDTIGTGYNGSLLANNKILSSREVSRKQVSKTQVMGSAV